MTITKGRRDSPLARSITFSWAWVGEAFPSGGPGLVSGEVVRLLAW